EIGDLQRSEVHNGEIKIAKDRYKTGVEFHNPLADMAIEILKSIPKRKGEQFYFGTVPGKGLDMTSANRKIDRRIARAGRATIDQAHEIKIREMLAAGVPKYRIRKEANAGWNTIKQVKARVEAGIPVEAMQENPKLPHWTVHDIRRTFRTKLSECGVPG